MQTETVTMLFIILLTIAAINYYFAQMKTRLF